MRSVTARPLEGRHFGGPSLFSDKPAADLRTIITDGKHRMPKCAGKLTTEEIDTLVQQIAALEITENVRTIN